MFAPILLFFRTFSLFRSVETAISGVFSWLFDDERHLMIAIIGGMLLFIFWDTHLITAANGRTEKVQAISDTWRRADLTAMAAFNIQSTNLHMCRGKIDEQNSAVDAVVRDRTNAANAASATLAAVIGGEKSANDALAALAREHAVRGLQRPALTCATPKAVLQARSQL